MSHKILQLTVKRYCQTEIQSTLFGTIQQGHQILLPFGTQVNVKRKVTGSREGRRNPKACMLNVTHQLGLHHRCHRACTPKHAAASLQQHTQAYLKSLKGSLPTTPSTTQVCTWSNFSLLPCISNPAFPHSTPSLPPASFKAAMTHFGKAP